MEERGGSERNCFRLLANTAGACGKRRSLLVPRTEQLIIRAIDSTGASQPETVAWNLKGYLYNAWYRLPIRVGS